MLHSPSSLSPLLFVSFMLLLVLSTLQIRYRFAFLSVLMLLSLPNKSSSSSSSAPFSWTTPQVLIIYSSVLWDEKYSPLQWLFGATDPLVWKSRHPSQLQFCVILSLRWLYGPNDYVRISQLQAGTKEENCEANIWILCFDCSKKDWAFRSSIDGQRKDIGSLIHRSEHSESNLIDLSHCRDVSMMRDLDFHPSNTLMKILDGDSTKA